MTAGDSHTVAYNVAINKVFCWGVYRNSSKGKVFDPIREPLLFGSDLFKKAQAIKKAVSGSNHTLLLTQAGKVFAWGDPESGKLGRMFKTRRCDVQALCIEAIKFKNV